MPKPTTVRPITRPPPKATSRAGERPVRAALAVRTLASVATFMPKNPATALHVAPSTKLRAMSQLVSSAKA